MPRSVLLLVSLFAVLPAFAQNAQVNCAEDDRFRAFDFWIGQWNVTNAQGVIQGENHIHQVVGSCALQENWTGASGGGGKSFNYLNAETGKWHQLWVDAAGGHMSFEGAFTDGAMRFEGHYVYGSGLKTRMNMTFTPMEDGRVRQLFEESRDGGETWSVWFEGFYARKAH